MFSILFLIAFVWQFIIIYGIHHYRQFITFNGDNRLLNEYAMISARYSITGEMNTKRDDIITRWTQTQRDTILDQLDCGARAFELRPYLDSDNQIYAHVGGITRPEGKPIVVYKLISAIIEEMLRWSQKHPKEIVLLQFSHYLEAASLKEYYYLEDEYYFSEDCKENVLSLLKDYNIQIISDCNELDTLTLEHALSYPNGNLIAMMDSCSFEYRDRSLTCYTKDYTCYDSLPHDTSPIAWEKMKNFTTDAASSIPFKNGFLWGFGAHWESNEESDMLGTLHSSSLILDEERSNINAWAAEQLRSGYWKYINQIYVDNICHNGADLFAAVQEYNDNYAKRRANREKK